MGKGYLDKFDNFVTNKRYYLDNGVNKKFLSSVSLSVSFKCILTPFIEVGWYQSLDKHAIKIDKVP